MNITEFDNESIIWLADCYETATAVFDVEPVCASAKVQKRIRKWAEKYRLDGKNAAQYIGKNVSDEVFIGLLKECYDKIQTEKAYDRQIFDGLSADFTDETKSAVLKLFGNYIYYNDISIIGTDVHINVDVSAGYIVTLILQNASGAPEGEFEYLYFDENSLKKKDDEYIIFGKADCYEDSPAPFEIHFSGLKTDIKLFKPGLCSFDLTPWAQLKSVAGSVLSRCSLGVNYANEYENKLMPLAAEICKLEYFFYIPEESELNDFRILKSYIVKHGFNELLPFINKLKNVGLNEKKKERISKKLIDKLNTQKYEPLWRELYNLFDDVQADYPSYADLFVSPQLLEKTRTDIQKLMESHGYSGQYPDFIKKGSLHGVHLAESYDESYFVGAKKNAVYHIHCNEESDMQCLNIEFVCGTEFLKKGETPGDIYSCMFNAKGRRLCQTVCYDSNISLERKANIAVKKAEIKNLTKEERKESCFYDTRSLLFIFSFFFLAAGGAFGVLMTAGFMIIEAVLCLIFADLQAFIPIFLDTPWWAILFGSWILFGLIMGIITAISKRNN